MEVHILSIHTKEIFHTQENSLRRTGICNMWVITSFLQVVQNSSDKIEQQIMINESALSKAFNNNNNK